MLTTQPKALFPSLFSKPVLATFDQPDSSSDGGAGFMKTIDSEFELTKRLAACIHDGRESGKICFASASTALRLDMRTATMPKAWLRIPFRNSSWIGIRSMANLSDRNQPCLGLKTPSQAKTSFGGVR
jgi:hypothetical protein